MTSQLWSCLVIVLVIQLQTKICQAYPVGDDAVSDSDHQTFIKEFSKAAENTTKEINNAIKKCIDLADSTEIQNVIGIIERVNLNEIDGLSKDHKDLYYESLKQLKNVKKELLYIRINLEVYAEATIDRAGELYTLVRKLEAKQIQIQQIRYVAKKMTFLVDESNTILKKVIKRLESINEELTNIDTNQNEITDIIEAKQDKMNETRIKEQEWHDWYLCKNGTGAWVNFGCQFSFIFYNGWASIGGGARLNTYKTTLQKIDDIMNGLNAIDKIIDATENDLKNDLQLVSRWSKHIYYMSENDFANEEDFIRGLEINTEGIVTQLKTLAKYCQEYINRKIDSDSVQFQEIDQKIEAAEKKAAEEVAEKNMAQFLEIDANTPKHDIEMNSVYILPPKNRFGSHHWLYFINNRFTDFNPNTIDGIEIKSLKDSDRPEISPKDLKDLVAGKTEAKENYLKQLLDIIKQNY